MSGKRPVILLGAGGHARACIDVIEKQGQYDIAGLVGLQAEKGNVILGYPVLGDDSDLLALFEKYGAGVVTVGQIKTAEPRKRLFELLEQHGCFLPAIVSPLAHVSRHAEVGAGTVVMHGAIVNAGAAIGRNCIINSMALVEHDARIADHCHISTGARLNSGVGVGEGSFVGSGALVKQGVTIGSNCVIGMGVALRHNCPDNTVLHR